jgi:polar amino acid transport system substrate-binding protein
VTKRLLVLISALALIMAACGDDAATTTTAAGGECGPDHPALKEAGKLTVATGETVFPPWMLDDDPAGGEGFENSVVYAVAEELGFDADVSCGWEPVGKAPSPLARRLRLQHPAVLDHRRATRGRRLLTPLLQRGEGAGHLP